MQCGGPVAVSAIGHLPMACAAFAKCVFPATVLSTHGVKFDY
jgi:hypothetical protein